MSVFVLNNGPTNTPVGTITKTIGPIDILHNFYEYHIACKEFGFST